MNVKFLLSFAISVFMVLSPLWGQPEVDSRIEVRDGYELSVAVSGFQRPRFMAFDDDGRLYVSLPHTGQIKCCMDKDSDGYFETVMTFTDNHPTVHGMYWHDGWLWYAETGEVFRGRDTDSDGIQDEQETILHEGSIPRGGGHWWRPVLILNDRLYTGIGCSGNITDESDTERLKIWSFKLDGSDKKLFCSGLRNTEKLVVRPGTSEIWGMDHGSDWFGRVMEARGGERRPRKQPITDLNPPCEMNHLVEGGYYGHPFITGDKLPRYEYMDRDDIVELAARTIPPEWPTGAHWAPNAMAFYDGGQFPKEVKGDAFVGYHGSWNRRVRSGYCVTRVFFDEGKPYGELKWVNFITDDQTVLGRPVDVVVAPDGSLLISDDWGHKVYRLSYKGKR